MLIRCCGQWSCRLLWVPSLVFGGWADLRDTLSLYVMGLTATAISFYVVVPYGLVCQYVMESVFDTHEACSPK